MLGLLSLAELHLDAAEAAYTDSVLKTLALNRHRFVPALGFNEKADRLSRINAIKNL